MTTVNLVTNYSAVPDGQRVTTTVTISSTVNPTHLTVSDPIFVSGDVNKLIAIAGASNDPNTAFAHLAAISTVTDSRHVILSTPCTATVNGVAKAVEWGTDNSPAFQAFNAAFTGDTNVQLDIPGNIGTGRYSIGLSGFGGLGGGSYGAFYNIKTLLVNGTNSPILSNMLGTGGLQLGGVSSTLFDNYPDNFAYVDSVDVGETQVVLKDSGQASLFHAGDWGLMTGLSLQTFGYPPNPHYLEWVQITNVTGSTITFAAPLRFEYLDTWPVFNIGLAGPAALFVVRDGWGDTNHNYKDLVIEQGYTVVNANGRIIKYQDSSFPYFGPNISTTQNFTLDNCNVSSYWEIDKINDVVNFINSNVRFYYSSSSTNTMNITGCEVQVGGTPKNAYFTNCNFHADSGIGPISYGQAIETIYTNCNFDAGIIEKSALRESDIAGAGAYAMSGGVISRVKSAGSSEYPIWAIPGHYAYWFAREPQNDTFKVLSVYDDATNVYVQTDEVGGFPTFTFSGSPAALGASAMSGQRVSYINCTGDDLAVGMSNAPTTTPFAYWHFNYTGDGIGESVIPIIGNLVSCTVNVTKAYAGGSPLALTFTGFAIKANEVTNWDWNPSIDLKTTGSRVFTPGSTSAPLSAADSLGSAAGNIWLVNDQNQPVFSRNISLESPSDWPEYTITIITDQGLPADAQATQVLFPFRLRLH